MIALAPGLTITATAANEIGVLRSPYGGEIRALVIGIDAYRHVRPLKGAVADARDIETSLRKSGVRGCNRSDRRQGGPFVDRAVDQSPTRTHRSTRPRNFVAGRARRAGA